jgi:hypothetical protein
MWYSTWLTLSPIFRVKGLGFRVFRVYGFNVLGFLKFFRVFRVLGFWGFGFQGFRVLGFRVLELREFGQCSGGLTVHP